MDVGARTQGRGRPAGWSAGKAEQSPGVSADTLHFATVITPDADPVKRQGMLAVLERFFADKNEFLRGGRRTIQSAHGIKYLVTRAWRLHVWELSGPPENWQAQLDRRLAEEPVFALISGLGGRTWAPVHRFCERAGLPCLFPNVDLPVAAEDDFYSVYLSPGVLLEAQLMLRSLGDAGQPAAGGRVIQIYRKGDIGEQAARSLRAGADAMGLKIVDRALDSDADLPAALAHTPGDALVLWLRPPDLRALPAAGPGDAAVYLSGILADLERAPLPAAWRATARMAYPFDPPERRAVRMNYPLGWLRVRQVPVVAERVQSDTYLACGILAENLTDMLDSFVRDYLLERSEVMLSSKLTTAYYPRLTLAPGQRFTSRGGYLARLDGSGRVLADTEWIVP